MMNRTSQHSLQAVDRRLSSVDHPRGFTFVEVLFAIIILGIGMIMLAAMLPVAISQTAQTRDQIAGKGAVEAGYAYIKAIAQSGGTNAFPATVGAGGAAGQMQPASTIVTPALTPGLDQYKLSRILSSDPSVQWVPFYRRDAGSSVVRFIVLATRISSNEAVKEYSTTTMDEETSVINAPDATIPAASTNGPHLYRVSIVDSKTTLGDYDELTFHDESSGTAVNPPMAAAGTYVILREQNGLPAAQLQNTFRNNGRIFKLLSKKDENPLDTKWLLDPEFDLPAAGLGPDGVTGTPDDIEDVTLNPGSNNERATAWIIGRAAIDPTSGGTNPPYSGVTQDIGILKFDLTLPN